MQVTHIVPAEFRGNGIIGGAERYAYELALAMAKQVPTRLVAFADVPSTTKDGQLEIRVLGPAHYPRGQRQNPLALGMLREIFNADVLHFHQQNILASSLGAIAARALRRKAVVTDLGGGGWDLSSYVSTERLFQAHLHISEYSRRVFGHDGKASAEVILGGVDTERFAPAAESEKSDEQRPVLFVGRLLPHKSVHTVIDAAPEDMPVSIVGPAMDPTYAKLLHEKAAGKNVEFRVSTNDRELASIYRSSLCVVLPSVYDTIYGIHTEVPELLGQTLLEGMACGIPAICTDVASMPEVVVDGVTGFVVPPAQPEALRERLIWLATHPDERAKMGRAARARVLERFRWDQVVERCFSTYRRLGAAV